MTHQEHETATFKRRILIARRIGMAKGKVDYMKLVGHRGETIEELFKIIDELHAIQMMEVEQVVALEEQIWIH